MARLLLPSAWQALVPRQALLVGQWRGAKAKAGAAAGGKGAKGGPMVKVSLDVETDAKKLVKEVCWTPQSA
jgi:hypothetical protein